jgi:MFS family permease
VHVPASGRRRGLSLIGAAFGVSQYPKLWLNSFIWGLNFLTYGMAQGWLILELTDSPAMVGVAPGIMGVTVLVLGPFGGLLADRFDRRLLLLITQVFGASMVFGLGLLVVLDMVQLWHVFTVAAFQGVGRAVQFPARGGYTYDLVGRSLITNALALQFLAIYLAAIGGPLLGGFILDQLNAGVLFMILGALVFLGSMLLLTMPSPPKREQLYGNFLRNLTEGITFAMRDRQMRTVFWVVLFTELLGFSFLFMLPVMVRDVLHQDATALGYLSAAWGTGGVLTTLVISMRGDLKARGWLFMGAAVIMGIFLLLFSFSTTLLLSMALLFGAGSMGVVYDIMGSSLFQTMAPDHMRGRLIGLHSTLLSGATLGSFGIGAVAEVRSAPFAIAIAAVIVAVNALRMAPVASAISRRSAGNGEATPDATTTAGPPT